jgi:4-hydroxybenzoate polyprenyltransferase
MTVAETEQTSFERVHRILVAVLVVNRLPATLGYNVAYFFIGVALAWEAFQSAQYSLLVWFGVAVLLAKMQASVADAIHDREADAINPANSAISRSVDRLGLRRAWWMLLVELIGALIAFAVVAMLAGEWLFLAIGVAFVLLGFCYSYPPRLKRRGVLNHVVTTGVDVCFVVLPIPYLLVGTLPTRTLLVGAMVALYGFAYHVVHQAADVYYDRRSGIETFARSVGAPRSIVLAAAATSVALGLAIALGYPLASIVLLAVTVHYIVLYWRTRDRRQQRQSAIISTRFSIAWVATVLNTATALSVLLRANPQLFQF